MGAAAPPVKPWYRSKTVWVAILTVAGGITVLVGKWVPPAVGVTAIIKGILDLILRIVFTTGPIG